MIKLSFLVVLISFSVEAQTSFPAHPESDPYGYEQDARFRVTKQMAIEGRDLLVSTYLKVIESATKSEIDTHQKNTIFDSKNIKATYIVYGKSKEDIQELRGILKQYAELLKSGHPAGQDTLSLALKNYVETKKLSAAEQNALIADIKSKNPLFVKDLDDKIAAVKTSASRRD